MIRKYWTKYREQPWYYQILLLVPFVLLVVLLVIALSGNRMSGTVLDILLSEDKRRAREVAKKTKQYEAENAATERRIKATQATLVKKAAKVIENTKEASGIILEINEAETMDDLDVLQRKHKL